MLLPLLAIVLPLLAQPPHDSLAADSIIAHYVAAVGGHAALIADTTLSLSGHYREGDFRAQTTILWKRPNLRRVTVVLPDGFSYVELFDGRDEFEFQESFSRPVQHDTGAAERAGRRGAEFDESFVDYRSKGHTVASKGTVMLAGKSVNELSVTLADGWTKEYYFDSASGLLVALRKAMPLHAAGSDVVSLSYFSDYRSVGGVLRPFAQEERNVATGALMNELHWDTIRNNITVRPEAFVAPGARRDAVDGPPPRKASTPPQ